MKFGLGLVYLLCAVLQFELTTKGISNTLLCDRSHQNSKKTALLAKAFRERRGEDKDEGRT